MKRYGVLIVECLVINHQKVIVIQRTSNVLGEFGHEFANYLNKLSTINSVNMSKSTDNEMMIEVLVSDKI